MYSAHSLHPVTSILLRALFLFLLLLLPLSGGGLRAQVTDLTLGLTPADRQVLAARVLTMEDMRKFAAVGSQLAEVAMRDPKVCALLGQDAEGNAAPENRSLDVRAGALNTEPVVRDALLANGITARDYIVITLTYVATMADNVARMTGRALFDEPLQVHPANRTFLTNHDEEIARLMAAIPTFCEES